MLFPKSFLYISFGVLIGVLGSFWFAIGGFASPEPQDTTPINVGVAQFKPEDKWLQQVRFQLIPLDGVRSVHKYAILLLTPPSGGIPHLPSGKSALLDLIITPEVRFIQPISVGSGDFGPNGDQVVVKFIDEMFRPDKSNYYQQSQHFWISSSPNQ